MRIKKYKMSQFITTIIIGFLLNIIFIRYASKNTGAINSSNLTEIQFLCILAAIAAIFGVWNWRLNVKFVLFLLLFEGALRKWVFLSYSSSIYMAKDIFIILAYLGYFFSSLKNKKKIKIKMNLTTWRISNYLLAVFLLYGIVELFNPRTPVLLGLFGFKAYFLYIPLTWLTFQMFETSEDLINFLYQILLLAIPMGVLGGIQFFESPLHPLNRYAAEGVIATFGAGGKARVSGTFAFVTGNGVFFFFVFCLVIGFIIYRRNKSLKMIPSLIVLIFSVGNILMTGYRAYVLQSIVATVFFLLSLIAGSIKFIRAHFLKMVIVIAVIGISLSRFFPNALEMFQMRLDSLGMEDLSDRVKESTRFPSEEMELAGGIGFGLGSTQHGKDAILDKMGISTDIIPTGIGYEEEPERIMLELGSVGFSIYYLFRVFILIGMFNLLKLLLRCETYPIAFGLFMFMLLNGLTPLVFNHIFNVLFWFSAGVILALYQFNQQKT